MNRTTFYTTIEDQVRSDGSHGLLYDHFDSLTYKTEAEAQAQAEAKFYTICAAAAVSEIPYHAAYLIQSGAVMLGFKVYDRRTEPTPEPTSEEA